MGYALAFSPCLICHQPFGYNPLTVPSFAMPGREKEPICRSCMDYVNAKRKEQGLPPHPVREDAYEPIDGSAL